MAPRFARELLGTDADDRRVEPFWTVAVHNPVPVVAVGAQDAGGGVLMARDSIFRVASITKSVTAAALLILVEEGTIAPDDPSPAPPGTVGRCHAAPDQDERHLTRRGLNDRITEDDRVDTVMLPVRDGITIARRR